jgi:hypothetical protein
MDMHDLGSRGSTNAVIVSVMVVKKDKQAAEEKQSRKPWTLRGEVGGMTAISGGTVAAPRVLEALGCRVEELPEFGNREFVFVPLDGAA